jgi:hypothetical protein
MLGLCVLPLYHQKIFCSSDKGDSREGTYDDPYIPSSYYC